MKPIFDFVCSLFRKAIFFDFYFIISTTHSVLIRMIILKLADKVDMNEVLGEFENCPDQIVIPLSDRPSVIPSINTCIPICQVSPKISENL